MKWLMVLFMLIPVYASAGWFNKNSQEPNTPNVAASTTKVGKDCVKSHKEKADANVKNRIEFDAATILPSTKGISEMSCLDKYKNVSLAGMLGIPSLSNIFDQLKGQACRYIDSQVGRATEPLNQSVWLPGGGRVNTGVVFGDQAKGKGPVSGKVYSSGNVQLPQIFK